jgi:hypothetical protein
MLSKHYGNQVKTYVNQILEWLRLFLLTFFQIQAVQRSLHFPTSFVYKLQYVLPFLLIKRLVPLSHWGTA